VLINEGNKLRYSEKKLMLLDAIYKITEVWNVVKLINRSKKIMGKLIFPVIE
jgi:hypothetical protein